MSEKTNPLLVKKAEEFAKKAHEGQKYGESDRRGAPAYEGPVPFIVHPADVAKMTELHDFSDVVTAAAWLHDVIEDTDVTEADVRHEFGDKVADLVWAVTDEPGKNRKERAANTLPKTRAAGTEAVGLKLCDRLSNVAAARRDGSGLFKMYCKERDLFRDALFHPGEHVDLWSLYNKLLSKED